MPNNSINQDIILKGHDQASPAINKVSQVLRDLEKGTIDASTATKLLKEAQEKAGKSAAGLTGYIKEQRMENRQNKFIMGEIKDAVGGVSIAMGFLGVNAEGAGSSVKKMANTTNSAFAAFSAADAVVSALGTTFTVLAGPVGITITVIAAVAGALISMEAEAKKTQERINKLTSEINGLKHELKQMSDQEYFDSLAKELGEQEVKLQKLKEVSIDYAATLWNLARGNYLVAMSVNGTKEEIAAQTAETLKAQKATADAGQAQIDEQLRVLGVSREATAFYVQNNAIRLSNATKDAVQLRKIEHETTKQSIEASRTEALEKAKTADEKSAINKKFNAQQENERLKYNQAISDIAANEIALDKANKNNIYLNSAEVNKEIALLTAKTAKEKLAIENAYTIAVLQNELTMNAARKDISANDIESNRQAIQAKIDNQKRLAGAQGGNIDIESGKAAAIQLSQLQVAIMDEGLSKVQASLTLQMNAELKQAQESITNTEQLEKTKSLIKEKYRKQSEQAEIESQKKVMATVSDMIGFYGQYAALSSQMSQDNMNARIDNIESERDAANASFQAQLDAEGITAEQSAAIRQRQKESDAAYNEQIKAGKLEVWQAEKEAKKKQALISGAQAVITALGGAPPPLNAILAGITAGLVAKQISAIDAQSAPKFHEGGTAFVNAPANREFPIIVRGGETIRTERQEALLQSMMQNNGRGGATVHVHINSPFTDVEAVKKAVQKGLEQTNLSVDKYFVNRRNNVNIAD